GGPGSGFGGSPPGGAARPGRGGVGAPGPGGADGPGPGGPGGAGFGGGFGPPPGGAEAASRSNGGAGFIPGIPRLGIPDLNMADSAVGVARGGSRSRYSTGLPSTPAEAASWDPKVAYDYGALIGRELRDQ